MILKKCILLSILFFCNTICQEVKYNNYALYNMMPENEKQLEILQSLIDNRELNFLEEPVKIGNLVTVLSSPHFRSTLDKILETNDLEAKVAIENFQEVINNQVVGNYVQGNVQSMTWEAYYTLEDIYTWLDDLASDNPETVSVIVGGTSYEGYDIKGVKISHGNGRRNIFIESGIHAREWIAPATANYIITELIYSNDPETRAAANDFDWYIFPVTNPDGYIWTFIGDRLWRKSRRPVGASFGIDLNRNWNSNWGVMSSSVNPASNNYAGSGPFSEIETRSLSTYIQNLSKEMDMYISFHSSGQLLMVPYGNTTNPLENYYDSVRIARNACRALALRHGTVYVSGNVAETIYYATGTSVDWVKEKLGVPLVYIYELRDKPHLNGHLLPADQILENNLEIMDSVLALIREGRAFGYMNSSSISKLSFLSMFITLFIYIIL